MGGCRLCIIGRRNGVTKESKGVEMTGTELLRRLDGRRGLIKLASLARSELNSLVVKNSVFKPADDAMQEVMEKLYGERDALEARIATLKEEE